MQNTSPAEIETEDVEKETLEETCEDQGYSISDEIIREIIDLLNEDNIDDAARACDDLNSPDLADLFEKLNPDRRKTLTEILEHDLDAEVFAHIEPEVRNQIFENMDDQRIAAIVTDLDSDDALHLIEDLDDERQKDILRALSRKVRSVVEEGLTFPEDSAGRLMQRELVAVPQFWTVGKTLDYLRAAGETLPGDFYDIFVVDPMHRVVGEVKLSQIMRSVRSTKIQDLSEDTLHTLPANMDQEEVAFLFRKDGLASAPVVDENNRLIGAITVDDIVHVVDEEAQEDLFKLGGVENSDIYRAALGTVRSRFSWLAVNLLTAIAASVVIGVFEGTIQQVVALAVLMPIVASMGGNAGTQTLTVAVRALATKELSQANAWRIIGKELVVGVINGISFAVIMGAIAWLWFSNPVLGLVIAIAMVVNLVVAGLAGVAIPLILNRLGQDPAVSSAVFLTTVTDVLGFFAFLGLAAWMLV